MRAILAVTASTVCLLLGCSSNSHSGSPSNGGTGAQSQGGGANGSGGNGTGANGGSNGTGGGSYDGGVPPPPAATCNAPALAAVDSPDHVVGDGTAASCTADTLQTAATAGGTIVFDCGADPITITISSPITFTKESVLDGAGLVTLSGGGSSRILYLDSGYDQTTPRLTVQRLTFIDGQSPNTGEDTAQGGGAIYRDGGSLTVNDCTFENNHAPATGQDVAGGAIYAFGGGETVIVGSTFTGNSASDGGAVGSLNGDLTVINSSFVGNAATGTDGNPGNGGCGGGLYMDGADEVTSLCGVTISNNTAGAIAGGFFRVSNYDNGTFTMDRTTVSDNRVTPTADGNAGAMYLQGLALTITSSTIARNQAFYNGGIWISGRTADLTNVTIAGNTAFGSNGGGMWLSNNPTGTLLNCTIADNHSTATDQVAGAIFGGGLTLKNSIVAGNTAMWVPGCDQTHGSGGGNLQWPDGALCTDAPLVEDPKLGTLGDHGGVTETVVPASGSPAIALGSGCPPTDQRGDARAEPCTAGAVEVQ